MLITLARKPLTGSVASTCLTHGTGALNIDASRIGTGTGEVTTVTVPDLRSGNFGQDTAAYKDRPKLTVQRVDQGRWPANVLLVGSDAVLAGFPDTGKSTGGQASLGAFRNGDVYGKGRDERWFADPGFGDSGSAARFFKHISKDTP